MSIGPRPSLPDDFGVGFPVIVIQPGRSGRRIEAVVTKAARVWITINRTDGESWPVWRMRRDDQREKVYAGIPTRFATPEQLAWDDRVREARKVIQGERIEIYRSSWQEPEKLLTLAEFITQWNADHSS